MAWRNRAGVLVLVLLLFATAGCEERVALEDIASHELHLAVGPDAPVRLALTLGPVNGKCPFLGAPATVKATLNRAPMGVIVRGGGDDVRKCRSFEAVAAKMPSEPGAHVEVTDGATTIVVEAPDLFVRRTLKVVTPKQEIRAGARIMLAYEPDGDLVLGSPLRDFVTITSLTRGIAGVPDLVRGAQAGTFFTTLPPALAPDRYSLALEKSYIRPLAKVTRCEGVKTCLALPAPPVAVMFELAPEP